MAILNIDAEAIGVVAEALKGLAANVSADREEIIHKGVSHLANEDEFAGDGLAEFRDCMQSLESAYLIIEQKVSKASEIVCKIAEKHGCNITDKKRSTDEILTDMSASVANIATRA